MWTSPERTGRRVVVRFSGGRSRRCFIQQLEAEREHCAAAAMGEKPKVPDADETRRQYVQQESAQELIDRQSHQPLLILVSGIAPAESDDAISERDEAAVRDCHSMGVLAEIAKCMLRTAKSSLRINHPFGTEPCGRSQASNAFGFRSGPSVPWKPSLCSACSVFRPSTNLPRNTFLRTSTGRKNFCCDSIHRE